jgi:hypothetical protein
VADSDAPAPEDIIQGFGAPLWVLALAVCGAALFTLRVIVQEICYPPDFVKVDRPDLRKRVFNILQYQMFLLASPFIVIFVYQALVLAGAASQPLTVAIAMLGAGLALNVILDRASSAASRAMERSNQ